MSKTLEARVKLNTTQAEQKLRKLSKAIDAINSAVDKQAKSYNKVNSALNQVIANNKKVVNANKQAANSANKIAAGYSKSKREANGLLQTVKKLANAYLGVMAARAAIGASDTITSAENKLNYLNGGNTRATSSQMDKMYAAAQNSRMGYSDMMSNVSKSMTLAPKAFQDNIDNAIRFQEIMAKSYTLGGASAAEQSSSMYQMIQALGSGVLQGDELRSVREGAPLAYQAIEKFAQGIYGADKNLKDLASDGMITSDLVVAAIMSIGDSVDEAFKNTDMTFAQMWTVIKNDALNAFRVIQDKLNALLNDGTGEKLLNIARGVINSIATLVVWLADMIISVITWIADNWEWLRYIIVGALSIIAGYLIYVGATAVISAGATFIAWAMVHWQLALIILILGALVAAIVWVANTAKTGCDFIVGALSMVALAIVLIGVIMGSTALVIVGLIIALVAVFIQYAGEIIGCTLGIYEVIKAVCSWIDTAWSNMCNNLAAWFWNAVADMLEGVDWLLNGINKIREALNMDTISVSGIREKANSYKSRVVENNLDLGAAWNSGYSRGYAIGENIQSKVDSWGNKAKNALTDLDLGALTGSDLGSFTAPDGSSYDAAKALDDIANSGGKTAGNTGKMADAMDLTEEDLAYLRQLAEMEWKKEFTTANITVDMSNYNTISGDGDLDGIVTKLTDKLYEELDYVANGVYSY